MRLMRLFVLSSGYVAVFANPVDVEYWGAAVINLAFGSEIPAHEAVERMRYANPDNIVSFAGGIVEYSAHLRSV